MRISPTPIAAAPVLLPAALLGLGCGDDDSGGGSAAPPSEARDVPSDAGELKERCVDELTQMGQSDAEAKRMCTVPDAEDVDKAVDAALKSCLKVAAELPAGDVRDQAKQGCRDSAD